VKTWRVAALVVAVGLGAIVTRVFWDGRRALAAGDEAMGKGDVPGALLQWRRAARWYAPLAPHVADAYERMEALARAAEEKGDDATALEAWRGIRSSSLATRSFYTPYADRLAVANERIAALMARVEVKLDPKKSEAERRTFHFALLVRDEAPSVPWSLLALAGFGTWVFGGFWLARRGVTPTEGQDRLDKKNAIRAAALIAVGLFAWMLGLYKA
jgi:hypothetical protein